MSKDNVLRSTMGAMARDNDNEAVIALRQATRMLKARGLDWSAIADMAIEAANDNANTTASSAQSAYRAQPQPQPKQQSRPQPEPQPKPKPEPSRIRVSGESIPQTVTGDVTIILRERTRSGGTRLVFTVRNGTTTFGPIVAYQKHVVSTVENAYLHGRSVKVSMLTKGEGRPATATTPFMPQAGYATHHY